MGYVKETFAQGSPELKAKTVSVEKRDAGIAWGAVYAQYLSPISDVKQQGGELNVEKKLYVERISAGGSKSLQPVTEGTVLSVGDKIVARLTIRLDRTMDFVQLKDQRGACFEPIGFPVIVGVMASVIMQKWKMPQPISSSTIWAKAFMS